MSDMPPPLDYESFEPPPLDYDNLEPPPDIDFGLPDDPFSDELVAAEPSDFDYLPDNEPFEPFSAPAEPEPAAETLAPPTVSEDDGWAWHDAALIVVERGNDDSLTYSVGAVDLYANPNTGDLGGSYLEIDTFDDLDTAAGEYHRLQGELHTNDVLPFEIGDFAEEEALDRAAERGDPAPTWRTAGQAEYAAYEEARSPSQIESPDLPPDDFEIEVLLEVEETPAQSVPETEPPAFKALRDIGISADGFDPEVDPPPFIDPQSGTAYWIGVFQPDRDDPDNCVTSILSLGRDPDTGEVEAQLAPIVPGDWDKSYSAAEYLLGVVERGGIERTFEAAEGMALAADQRDLWEGERGIPLEPEAAQDLADYTRDQWEIDL